MPWKALEKSGLEPAAPNSLADRKHCALSTQPNPHLQNRWFIDEFYMHFAEPAIWPSSIRTEDPTCANHVDVLTIWSVFPSYVHINILRGLPCRLESLRLKFTNEPTIFVVGDLVESLSNLRSPRCHDFSFNTSSTLMAAQLWFSCITLLWRTIFPVYFHLLVEQCAQVMQGSHFDSAKQSLQQRKQQQ